MRRGARLLAAFGAALLWASAPAATVVLSDQCPASFERRGGHCWLHTPYQQYQSLNNAGVGGLKTGLPPFRDGFTPAQIDLGRYLFFDPALSANGKVACATCHSPTRGFADTRPRSIGVAGQPVKRNAPSLWNVGFLQRFFWDGRAHSLEEQVQGPLYGPVEMGTTPARLVATLNGIPTYRRLFAQAFPDAASGDHATTRSTARLPRSSRPSSPSTAATTSTRTALRTRCRCTSSRD